MYRWFVVVKSYLPSQLDEKLICDELTLRRRDMRQHEGLYSCKT